MTDKQPSEKAMSAAEAYVLREMMEQLQIPASRVQPWVASIARVIEAARREENEACEAVARGMADPISGFSDYSQHEAACRCAGAEAVALAIAARRKP